MRPAQIFPCWFNSFCKVQGVRLKLQHAIRLLVIFIASIITHSLPFFPTLNWLYFDFTCWSFPREWEGKTLLGKVWERCTALKMPGVSIHGLSVAALQQGVNMSLLLIPAQKHPQNKLIPTLTRKELIGIRLVFVSFLLAHNQCFS